MCTAFKELADTPICKPSRSQSAPRQGFLDGIVLGQGEVDVAKGAQHNRAALHHPLATGGLPCFLESTAKAVLTKPLDLQLCQHALSPKFSAVQSANFTPMIKLLEGVNPKSQLCIPPGNRQSAGRTKGGASYLMSCPCRGGGAQQYLCHCSSLEVLYDLTNTRKG